MTSYVESLINTGVNVITNEGRVFSGILKSFDQSMNIILTECVEKIYSPTEGVKFESMGLYMIRGDNVSIVSEVDQQVDQQIDYSQVRGEPIKEMKLH